MRGGSSRHHKQVYTQKVEIERKSLPRKTNDFQINAFSCPDTGQTILKCKQGAVSPNSVLSQLLSTSGEAGSGVVKALAKPGSLKKSSNS